MFIIIFFFPKHAGTFDFNINYNYNRRTPCAIIEFKKPSIRYDTSFLWRTLGCTTNENVNVDRKMYCAILDVTVACADK